MTIYITFPRIAAPLVIKRTHHEQAGLAHIRMMLALQLILLIHRVDG